MSSSDVDVIGAYACVGMFALGVLATMAAVVWHGVRSENSWLVRGKKVQLGAGEYRSAPATTDPRLLRRRWVVIGVAATSIPWATFTFFILVPGGFLAGLMAAEASAQSAWFWWCMFAAAFDGIVVSMLLVVAAFTLVRRSEKAAFTNVVATVWSSLHHAAIAAIGIAFAFTPYNGEVGIGTAAIAGIGLVHALACGFAAWIARPEPASPQGV